MTGSLSLTAKMDLPLDNGWPVFERTRRFVLGQLLDGPALDLTVPVDEGELAQLGIGRWKCDLPQDRLTWSEKVYDIFGLPRNVEVTRAEAVTFYCEHSRSVMERLRADAIGKGRGFILDAEIRPGHGEPRWMRLIAYPVRDKDRVVSLQGLKQLI